MIRIDHLFSEQYQDIPKLRDLLIEQPVMPALVDKYISDDDTEDDDEFLTRIVHTLTKHKEVKEDASVPKASWSQAHNSLAAVMREIKHDPAETNAESHCYVSRRQRQVKQPIPQIALDANTVIVSCGMTNYESTVYTDGRHQQFRQHLGDRKVNVNHFRNPKQEHFKDKEIFLESFKKNYPELSQGRDIHLVDCTGFDILSLDSRLKLHTGNHPAILKSIVESQKFTIINQPVRDLMPFRKNLIINVCKYGRQESVGNATAQKAVVQDQLYGVNANQRPETTVQLLYLQADSHWDDLCDNTGDICSLCDPSIRQNRNNMQRSYGLLKHMIPSPFNVQLSPTTWNPPSLHPQRPPNMPPMFLGTIF